MRTYSENGQVPLKLIIGDFSAVLVPFNPLVLHERIENVVAHDIQEEAALCHQVMLLARRVVALGTPQQVLTRDALLETFGIVITSDQKRLHVLESRHGHDDKERLGIDKPGLKR